MNQRANICEPTVGKVPGPVKSVGGNVFGILCKRYIVVFVVFAGGGGGGGEKKVFGGAGRRP